MITSRNECLAKVLSIPVLFLLFCTSVSAEIICEIPLTDREPDRILESPQSGEYWVVMRANGLLRLSEDENGNWSTEEYVIIPIYDATGPDANGLLYLSFADYGQSGVYVFDCATHQIVDTVTLGTDYPMRGLTLSNDETKLYVLGWDWPRVGELNGGWVETTVHRDSGIVWEIDTDTKEVTDQAPVSALPETIHYTSCDTLLVYSEEVHYRFDISPDTAVAMIDVLQIEPRLGRITQIETLFGGMYYENDFIEWSPEDSQIAMFASLLDWTWQGDERYISGVWVIDSETNEVVDTLRILDEREVETYVEHGVVSETSPGIVYITTQNDVLKVDKQSGAVIEDIDCGHGIITKFICETPDGLLIVTAHEYEQGVESGKILIIDPTE